MENMTHPFLNVQEIKESYSLEEIQEKIGQLLNRLTFSSRMGNHILVNQLQMAYTTYMQAYSEKLSESLETDGKNYLNKINIK